MARWYRLSMMALILLVVWGCGKSSSPRFTKAQNGVIADSATGLEWYPGPDRDTTWNQAKGWTENLSAAGGGWRMPTLPELKTLYQQGSGSNNLDPIFQSTGIGVWSGQLHSSSSAWGFNFGLGREFTSILANDGYKRAFAVRSRR